MGSFIEIDMGPKNENRFMCAVPLLGTFRALWLVDAVHEGYIAGPLIGQNKGTLRSPAGLRPNEMLSFGTKTTQRC